MQFGIGSLYPALCCAVAIWDWVTLPCTGLYCGNLGLYPVPCTVMYCVNLGFFHCTLYWFVLWQFGIFSLYPVLGCTVAIWDCTLYCDWFTVPCTRLYCGNLGLYPVPCTVLYCGNLGFFHCTLYCIVLWQFWIFSLYPVLGFTVAIWDWFRYCYLCGMWVDMCFIIYTISKIA